MTGKELILYILQNNLEDQIVLKNGYFALFMTDAEVASIFGVGTATVKAWHICGILNGTQIGNTIFFLKSEIDAFRKEARKLE